MKRDDIESTILRIPIGMDASTTESFVLDFLSLCARTYGSDISVGMLRRRLGAKGFERLWGNAILHSILKKPAETPKKETK